MSVFFQQVGLLWQSIATVWSWAWWILLPVIAGIIFAELWEQHQRALFHQGITWKVLELKVPQNILKTPKAMEQIFSAAFLEGDKHWMSFEMVGRAGESHFYLRLPSQFRNMMESAVYAQYPDAEITEVDDYIKQMPRVMPNQEFDLYGVEQGLAKDAWLPIKTYATFEDSVEERRIDSIAFLMESMTKLKGSEQIWIQLVVKPADEKWKKTADAAVNKLLGIEDKKKSSNPFAGFGLGISAQDIITSPFRHPDEAAAVKKEEKPKEKNDHPGKKEQVDGIRQKISKHVFEATVRAMYLDRREALGKDNLSSIAAFFRQFATQNLNAFKPEPTRSTTGKITGFFKKWQLALRKRDFFAAYAHARPTAGAKCILNTEELATVYHFPIGTVGTTELQKVGSRKGGPPATLPLMGE